MTSSASLLALLGIAASLTGPAAPAPAVPEPVGARVVAWVAREWGVRESDLRLEWGLAQGVPPAPDAPFRVAGRGTDGYLVVVFDPAGRAASAVRVRAGVEDSACVAARPLVRGSRLGPDDLRLVRRVRWGPPCPRTEPRPAAGWEVRRALASGEVLERPAVVPPPLVKAGDVVRFVWSAGAVQVSRTGVALNFARQGEIVRARVEGGTERLAGTAIAAGTAVLSNGGNP